MVNITVIVHFSMRKALLAVAVVFLMIVSMLAVASALPGNVIPVKNGTTPMQPHGYRSGFQASSSSAQSVPLAKLSTDSGANKLDSLLHNFNATAESPIQPNLLTSYKVTFTETGLPAGMPWQVAVENSSFPLPPIFGALFNMSLGIVNSSSGTSITISLANGSYVYYTGPASTDLGPYYFNVTGIPMNITIPFPAFYKVTFTESVLPSGMPWNVISFNNSSTNAETPFYYNISSSSSMVSYLPNGTYAFLAGPRSTYLFQKGFTVIGRSLSPSVVFPTFYTVTFTEVNLPSGEPWFLMANNTSSSTSYYVLYFNFSNAVSKIAYLPNGGYNYQATEGIFSESSVIRGSFIVNTAPETVKVIFPVTYRVTFTEENLPAGADWSVSASNYNGSVYYYNFSSGSSMTAYLPNGTYNYSGFWSSGGLSAPEREFNVTGAPLNLTVIFPVTYKITFTEENLPAGADWSVHAFDNNYSVNYYNASSGSTKIAFLQNGTYNYTGSFNGVATPEHEFNVTGVPLNFLVIFPVTYKITFTEENLPAGVDWSIHAYNSGVYYYNSSSGSSMTAYLPNGTYNYTGSFSGVTTPRQEFNVTGASTGFTVIFPVTYKITFTEKNLPADAYWNINAFNNNQSVDYSNSSSDSSMIAYLPNGTYLYEGYCYYGGLSTPYIEFNVTGVPMTFNVVFPETYSVVFTETGLPAGTNWFVSGFNSTLGYNFYKSSSTSTILVSLRNASYTYTVTTSLSGWKPSSSSGSFIVSGSPVNVPTITFSTTDHAVQFKESGLLRGTSWYVIFNATEETSTSNNITFYVPNGSYTYALQTPVPGSPGTRYVGSPSSGTVTVSGFNVSENVSYSTQYYLTTAVSPNGTGTVSPSSSWFSAGSSVTLTAKALSGYTFSSWSGSGTGSYTGTNNPLTLTMNGPVSETANFVVKPTIYTLSFTESGLPSGTSWTMTFNGATNSSTNSVMTFSAPNGTYSFGASNLSGYYTANYFGSISVKGNDVSIPIIYYHYAYISGTVTPHNATVDINGHSVSVSGSGLFNVSEASGTYSIVVSESGYITYYNNVTLTAGQTKELNVTLNPVKTTPPPISSSFPSVDLYGIIGAVVAIVAVVAVVSLMRKKH